MSKSIAPQEAETYKPKIGDRVEFQLFTLGRMKAVGVITRIGKFKHPDWGRKIIIQPDKPIDGYDGEVYRMESPKHKDEAFSPEKDKNK